MISELSVVKILIGVKNMETNTLAFFIGVQNVCLNHNKMITSMQWAMGNVLIIISIILSIFLYYTLKGKDVSKLLKKVIVGFWVFIGLFFMGYNVISLSMPIDEREAMEEVLKNRPEIAGKVTNDIETLKKLGSDFR